MNHESIFMNIYICLHYNDQKTSHIKMDPYSVTLDDKLDIKSYTKSFVEDILPEKCAMGYNILNLFDSGDRESLKHIFASCKTGRTDIALTKKKTLVVSNASNNFPVKIHIPWTVSYTDDAFSMKADRLDEGRNLVEAEELKDFFNRAPIALHWLSDEGKVLWANDRELSVLGYSREEYIGEDIMNFCPDSRDDVLTIFTELGSGNTIRDVPIRFRTKDGRIKDLLIDSNVNYKDDGSFNHTRCFIRDDTGRKIREAREETRKALSERLVAEKEKFIAKLIHHMKTPLHIMRMGVGTGSVQDEVDTSLKGMSKMLSNLSDAVKFDGGYTKPVDLVDCDISEFISGFSVDNITSSLQIEPSGLSNTKVRVDTNMLSTVIEEVVLFCDGYSSDGVVTLVAINPAGTDKYSFCVSYRGKKLNEVVVQNIFHRYWTSDSIGIADDSPTLGVGLNIAFNYTQCLGSDLWFDSTDESTSFRFDLRLERTQYVSKRRMSGSTDWDEINPVDDKSSIRKDLPKLLGLNESTERHILVVEDNTMCQKLMKRVIVKLGHTCDVADNGSMAVDMVCSKDYVIYDLVLMDIRMPIMDGIEATRIILEYTKSKRIKLPIVAVSAEESLGDDTGFTSSLKKPTSPADIERMISEYAY